MGRYLLEQPLMQHLVRLQLAKQGMAMNAISLYKDRGTKLQDGRFIAPVPKLEPILVGCLKKKNGSAVIFYDDQPEKKDAKYYSLPESELDSFTYVEITIALDAHEY